KFLKPETYECNLCQLTHGIFGESRKWKKFRKNSEIDFKFLHKDEYRKSFKSKFEALENLPVVLLQDNYDLSVFVSAKEINQMSSLSELIAVLEKRMSTI
ncbi:MAG: GTPase, partial [Psychroflexus sp.]